MHPTLCRGSQCDVVSVAMEQGQTDLHSVYFSLAHAHSLAHARLPVSKSVVETRLFLLVPAAPRSTLPSKEDDGDWTTSAGSNSARFHIKGSRWSLPSRFGLFTMLGCAAAAPALCFLPCSAASRHGMALSCTAHSWLLSRVIL